MSKNHHGRSLIKHSVHKLLFFHVQILGACGIKAYEKTASIQLFNLAKFI